MESIWYNALAKADVDCAHFLSTERRHSNCAVSTSVNEILDDSTGIVRRRSLSYEQANRDFGVNKRMCTCSWCEISDFFDELVGRYYGV
jgi:hypothetical protein